MGAKIPEIRSVCASRQGLRLDCCYRFARDIGTRDLSPLVLKTDRRSTNRLVLHIAGPFFFSLFLLEVSPVQRILILQHSSGPPSSCLVSVLHPSLLITIITTNIITIVIAISSPPRILQTHHQYFLNSSTCCVRAFAHVALVAVLLAAVFGARSLWLLLLAGQSLYRHKGES